MLRARSDHGGIFSGMISHPSPEAVVSELEKDTRTMGAPVISLRHGRNKIIWVHQLPEQGGSAGATLSRPAGPGAPTLPGVEVPGRDSEEQAGTGET